MKITFDSENFSAGSGRTILSVVLFIIAAFLIFHLGVMVGACKARHHWGYMHGGGYDNRYYDQEFSYDDMPMHDIYFTQAGAVGGQDIRPGMRVMNLDDNTAGRRVIYFNQ